MGRNELTQKYEVIVDFSIAELPVTLPLDHMVPYYSFMLDYNICTPIKNDCDGCALLMSGLCFRVVEDIGYMLYNALSLSLEQIEVQLYAEEGKEHMILTRATDIVYRCHNDDNMYLNALALQVTLNDTSHLRKHSMLALPSVIVRQERQSLHIDLSELNVNINMNVIIFLDAMYASYVSPPLEWLSNIACKGTDSIVNNAGRDMCVRVKIWNNEKHTFIIKNQESICTSLAGMCV